MTNMIEHNKIRSKALLEARKKINDSSNLTCLICGQRINSFCSSHSVPISVFDKMNLIDGKLCSHETVCQSDIITDIFSGKKNSGIFKNICRDCDSNFFHDLDNMDLLKETWNSSELRLQAIRILLYEIYRTEEFSFSFLEINEKHMSNKELKFNIEADQKKVNVLKHEFYSLLNDKSKKFTVIYEYCLDCQSDFCCVTLLSINLTPVWNTVIVEGTSEKLTAVTDENGNNTMHLGRNDKFGNYVYLVILPVNGKTKIMLYSDEKNIAGILLGVEFEKLSNDEILKKISAILSMSGNNIHGNERFFNKFIEYKVFCQAVYALRGNAGLLGIRTSDMKKLYQLMEHKQYDLFK